MFKYNGDFYITDAPVMIRIPMDGMDAAELARKMLLLFAEHKPVLLRDEPKLPEPTTFRERYVKYHEAMNHVKLFDKRGYTLFAQLYDVDELGEYFASFWCIYPHDHKQVNTCVTKDDLVYLTLFNL